MQNQTIPNGSKVDTEYGVFEVLDYIVNIESYFCYKHNFYGHRARKTKERFRSTNCS